MLIMLPFLLHFGTFFLAHFFLLPEENCLVLPLMEVCLKIFRGFIYPVVLLMITCLWVVLRFLSLFFWFSVVVLMYLSIDLFLFTLGFILVLLSMTCHLSSVLQVFRYYHFRCCFCAISLVFL